MSNNVILIIIIPILPPSKSGWMVHHGMGKLLNRLLSAAPGPQCSAREYAADCLIGGRAHTHNHWEEPSQMIMMAMLRVWDSFPGVWVWWEEGDVQPSYSATRALIQAFFSHANYCWWWRCDSLRSLQTLADRWIATFGQERLALTSIVSSCCWLLMLWLTCW